MEAGGKDCEEETLQTAFKKLRVDAESEIAALFVSEALAPRAASRACLDVSGAKPKLGCPKDNWHSCMRKTSRGASRSQRRRRSKSPILQPPKFTYCSTATAAALSTPTDGRTVSALNVPAQNELSCSGTPSHVSPLVFGSRAGYETHVKAPSKDIPAATTSTRQDRASFRKPRISGPADAADFRALSDQSDGQGWAGMEVYSFTGLRNVISECEMSLVSHDDAPRTTSTNGNAASPSTVSSGSPRSCSEQARGYVDDITIEDLSGYMEYYLYIPKKMSHMAEMMYT
uniref:Oxidative stress-responsive serine-rich protein 1 n=1 Tax=Mola mola TaxID=94237 RepID=A0A3Q3X573_MOLML